jgi:hypothetical protein
MPFLARGHCRQRRMSLIYIDQPVFFERGEFDMLTAEGLVTAFTRNSNFFHTHLKDLTHADTLVQPPVQGNCILWIVGHIVNYRSKILTALLQPALPNATHFERFARGSQPVLGEEPGLPRLETIISAYDGSQTAVIDAIRRITREQSAEVITQGDFTMPRADLVVSYMRHESYHLGQLELLREIALHAQG